MDGHVGVNAQGVRLSEAAALYEAFSEVYARLRRRNMTRAVGGNIIAAHGEGMVISASGANLGCLEPEELIHVTECREDDEYVRCHAPIEPFSETIMHWLIYTLPEKILEIYRPAAYELIHPFPPLRFKL